MTVNMSESDRKLLFIRAARPGVKPEVIDLLLLMQTADSVTDQYQLKINNTIS